MIELIAQEDYERLDIFLSEELDISRTAAQRTIRSLRAKREDKEIKLKPSTKVLQGQKFFVTLPQSDNIDHLKAEPVDFDVVYEDDYLVVVNKPAGIVVHPAPGNWRGTLVNGLVYRYPEMRQMTNWLRPGIVHRLDMGTSGLMVVARTQKALLLLQHMFRDREITKKYIALVRGCPEKREGILSGPLERDPNNFMKMAVIEGGKPSLTGYKVLWSREKISMVECHLFTGRMHQIRVHMAALGCPLVGDNIYGPDDGFMRVFLHSWKLEFTHPITKENLSFRQKITPDFIEIIHSY